MAFALKKEYLPNYTYDDYCKWEGRWELIDGVPYAMSPLPSLRHQDINSNILIQLKDLLKNCEGCKAFMPVDWKINDNTVVQPDVSVVCNPIKTKNFLDSPPTLVFEILSPSNSLKDRNIKFELYQSEKVKYYVIVDPEKETAEIFELQNNKYKKNFETANGSFEFNLNENFKFTFDFSSIWSE